MAEDEGDVIHKFNPDEVRELKKMGEVPDSLEVADPEAEGEKDNIVFEDTEVREQDPKRKGMLDFSDDEDEDEEEKKSDEDVDIDNI